MRTFRSLGMIVAMGLWGCGSSSPAKTTPTTVVDAAAPQAEVATPKADTGITKSPDTATPDTSALDASTTAADLRSTDGSNTQAPDTIALSPPDTPMSVTDGLPSVDAPQVSDSRSPLDGSILPKVDGGTMVSSTTVIDNATTLCSTVALGPKDLKADQTYDIVIPDCYRLSGTVTLAGPLPTGALGNSGSVQVMKLTRDGKNAVTDMLGYSASTTLIDGTRFKYTVGVPDGTYEVMFSYTIKSAGQIPSTATRYAQETLTVTQGMVHDVTLPAIEVDPVTVTITGVDRLPASGSLFPRLIELVTVNPGNTLQTMGTAMTSGPSIPISTWVPKGGLTPFIMVVDTPSSAATSPSGFISQFKLDYLQPLGDFTVAVPPEVKISGSVSDPNHSLSPMLAAGGASNSVPNYYHCDSTDTGSFPDPIFFYPEGSTSTFFSAATRHAVYVRKGIECITYAKYAIATGPGGTPTRTTENTYAFLDDPTPKSTNAVTLTSDLSRDLVVPALGSQITVQGTVKDGKGNAITNAQLDFNSSALSNVALVDKTFEGSLDVGNNGAFILHALPGTYTMRVILKDTQGATPTPDAGAPKDTGPSFTLPDVSFTLPDLGGNAGDCAALAACCATLSATTKMVCELMVSSNVAASCGAYLATQKQSGACP